MVDFQSRDTRRGPTTDDADDESAESDADAAEGAEAVADGSEADTPTDARAVGEASEDPETDMTAPDGATSEGTPTDARAVGEAGSADASERDEAAGDGTEPSQPPAETTDGADPPAASNAIPRAATPARAIDVAVVTVEAESAEPLEDAVRTGFESAGHHVATRERLRGGYDAVQQTVESLLAREDVDVVVTVGGVGIAPDELAIEAVHPLLEKALPGFGETLRSLLFEHVGTGIVGVRSAAGVAEGTLVFCLPGDAEAAGIAVEEILAVEAPELLSQLD